MAPVVYIVFVHVMAWAGALMLPECRGCGASIGRVGALSGRVLVAEVGCRVCVVLRRLGECECAAISSYYCKPKW